MMNHGILTSFGPFGMFHTAFWSTVSAIGLRGKEEVFSPPSLFFITTPAGCRLVSIRFSYWLAWKRRSLPPPPPAPKTDHPSVPTSPVYIQSLLNHKDPLAPNPGRCLSVGFPSPSPSIPSFPPLFPPLSPLPLKPVMRSSCLVSSAWPSNFLPVTRRGGGERSLYSRSPHSTSFGLSRHVVRHPKTPKAPLMS